MNRGEIWIVSGGAPYTGEPRPAVIVQDDRFDKTLSATICPFTTDPAPAPIFRLGIEPDAGNGLRAPCYLMADKISTVPRARLSERIGRLRDSDVLRMNRAILVFLGLAG